LGTFDGHGNTIRGIYINQPNKTAQGLFGLVGATGIIRNLNIADVNITAKDTVGGLVGRNSGIIESCRAGANVNVRSSGRIADQLVGWNVGEVSLNSTSSSSGSLTYREILTRAGLGEYVELFERHRITDIYMIRSLTNDELREMGIEAIGDRRRIMEAFSQALLRSNTQSENFAAHQKGNHNLDFAFMLGWKTGVGGNFAWSAGVSDMLSFGLGATYSANASGGARYVYLIPNCRLALHLLSGSSSAKRQELSRHDLHIVARAGASIFWRSYTYDKFVYDPMFGINRRISSTDKSSSANFMFNVGMGYRLYLSKNVNLLMEGGISNLTAGLGFRF
jgi:hypothetical protein